MDGRFTQLIDDATAGLKDDPELRLDVRAELAGHLDETMAEFAAEGHDEDESAALAAQSFGSPVDVAGALLAANKRRMRLRALARLFVRALLVPAAVVVAVLIGYGNLARVLHLMKQALSNQVSSDYALLPPLPNLPVLPELPSARTRETQRRIEAMFGSPDTFYDAAHTVRLRRLWEAQKGRPDERVYFAYYISASVIPLTPRAIEQRYHPNNNSVCAKELAQWQQFEQEMHYGMRLDPDNALYYYQFAQAYLRSGMMSGLSKAEKNGTDDLLDPADFAQGVAWMQQAYTRPYLTCYGADALMMRLKRIPEPRTTEDFQRMITLLSEPYPGLARYRELARKTVVIPRLLMRQGRRTEAEAFMQNWNRFPEQIMRGSETLIDVLVASAISAIHGDVTARIYREIGQPARAAQVEADMQRYMAPIMQFKQEARGTVNRQYLRKYGPVLGNDLLISAVDRPTPAEMAPARRYEYTMLEQLALGLLLVLLTLAMLGTGAAALVWQWRLKSASPLLLLPTWLESLRIIGLGVVMPVGLYLGYTLLPFSGREYGLGYLGWRAVIELCIVEMAILIVPALLMLRVVRARCRRLDVPVPSARYRGTLTHSLVPIYAAAVILLAFTVRPYLVAREVACLREERVLYLHPGAQNPFPYEFRLIQELKQATLKE